MSAWGGLLRAHSRLIRILDAELEESCGLSLAQYDVLVQLSFAPERRLRMTELADQVVLSRSGVTRLVDRMEAAGLVERRSCPTDLRGTFASLTELGAERYRAAAVVHVRGIRRHVTSRLSAADQRSLADVTAKLLADG